MTRHPLSFMTAAVLAVVSLSGCVQNNPNTTDKPALTVTSTAHECRVSASSAPSGSLVFSVHNTGEQVTEFYLLAEDGLRIVSEAENIGPGITRDLVINAMPGKYFTACKPGMTGPGVGKAAFTVTDSGGHVALGGNVDKQVESANQNYGAYVRDQVEQLVEGTRAFAKAYIAGSDDEARSLYPTTRMHLERIETVAESFGDLDPRLDVREADLEQGQEWTGWHAMEKDLWPHNAELGFLAYSPVKRAALANQLVDDTDSLYTKVQGLKFTLDQQANGAIGLLAEVASGKVTGEEEFWSHTDLWDFQANIDGAKVMFYGIRPVLEQKDPKLAATLDTEFTTLQKLLDAQRAGDGFRLYTQLSTAEIRSLSDAVNALAEPLSQLTAAVLL